MKKKLAKTQQSLLLVSGTLLILIATFINASPDAFYASNNIKLDSNVNLLNELKAPTGLLLASGVFMIGAIFVRSVADTALWLAVLIYLSYAVSRLASMSLDGIPAAGLVQTAVLEGVIGLACLVVLLIRRMPTGRVA